MTPSAPRPMRPGALVPLAAVVTLTLTTAYIHSILGGLLFTLNAIGYAGLAILIVVTSAVPAAIVQRLRWAPRAALAAYTMVTIGGYLVMGPYVALGWATKAIEVALLGGLAVIVSRDHGGIRGLIAEARASVSWALRVAAPGSSARAEVSPRET